MKDMLRTPTNSMDTGQPRPISKRYREGAKVSVAKVSAAKLGGQKGRDPAHTEPASLAKQPGGSMCRSRPAESAHPKRVPPRCV